jgi:flagellin
MVQSAFDAMTSAASQLGSLSTRIDLQTSFVSALSDTIDSGVGKLVDADMEEESSRLTALQTQQQLAIQSLQIANSSAQNVLSLFRSQ